ncbi:killer suppression protein [Smithella sp. SC_K08D17]|jgi:proteic killer suppression protein|nr:killer suppression protein [Smithella sp. D17]KIE16961.1 killer suppression protein [Smithella sp. SC_K08D17]
MKIYFKTGKLQKICSQEREMTKYLGTKKAGKLKQRLMELGAAETLADISHLPPARCHELTGKDAGTFSVDLEHPYRLLFISADDPVPLLADGGIDRKQVKEIEIIEIKDTH